MAARSLSGEAIQEHKGRWRIAWLLGAGVLVNYFDRVNLSVSHNALIAAFGISDVVYGALSSAYNWTYALCQLPVGVVLDKLGVRRVGRFGALLWSVASFAAAATPNLSGLFGARLLLGVGEAPTFPANAKAIGAWFPEQERSFATSLFDAAAKFASAIGVPLLGIVLIRAGWRWSFAFTGVVSFVYLLIFWKVYREPEEEPAVPGLRERISPAETQSPRNGETPASPLGRLLFNRKVVGVALGFGAYSYVFYLLLYWLPAYLSSALHVDLLHSFLYTSVPWLIAAASDLLVGGWLVDYLVQRGWNASHVRRVVLIGGMLFGLGILGAVHAENAAHAVMWISVSLCGLAASAPVAWSLPSLVAGPSDVGKVGGIINFSGQLSGIAAAMVTGTLVTKLHSYAWAFAIAGAYLAAGIAGYAFLLGKIEPEA